MISRARRCVRRSRSLKARRRCGTGSPKRSRTVGVERDAAVGIRLLFGLRLDAEPAAEILLIVPGDRLAPQPPALHVLERVPIIEHELELHAAAFTAVLAGVIRQTLEDLIAHATREKTLLGEPAAGGEINVLHEISTDLIGMVAAIREQQQARRFDGMRGDHILRALDFTLLLVERRHVNGAHRAARIHLDAPRHRVREYLAQAGALRLGDMEVGAVARAARADLTGRIREALRAAAVGARIDGEGGGIDRDSEPLGDRHPERVVARQREIPGSDSRGCAAGATDDASPRRRVPSRRGNNTARARRTKSANPHPSRTSSPS